MTKYLPRILFGKKVRIFLCILLGYFVVSSVIVVVFITLGTQSDFLKAYVASDNPKVQDGEVSYELSSYDATSTRLLTDLSKLYTWADGAQLFFSEVGIPNEQDAPQYSKLMEASFDVINRHNSGVAVWAVGDHWGDYNVTPYAPDTLESVSSSLVFDNQIAKTTGVYALNLAGGEFGLDADANGEVGGVGSEYFYHEGSDIWQRIKNRGFDYVRYPVRIERLYDLDDFSLDAQEVEIVRTAFDRARQADIQIIFDIHNYGAIQKNNRKTTLGERGFARSDYQKLLREIVTLTDEYGDVVTTIGLMNEPKNIKPKLWEEYSQAGLSALRDAGWEGLIEVPTGNWQGAHDAPEIHPKPWIVDPLDNFVYGVHLYMDFDYSGTYHRSYDEVEELLMKTFEPSIIPFTSGLGR